MRMDLTLDIPDVQIVVNYPGDGDGFFWHHRILLHRIEGAQWLTLSPDHEVVRHDLNAIPHRVLMRRAMFPQDIAHEVYAHNPIGLATLQNFKRQARIQATILGEGDVGESESFQWLIAEVGHARFGQEIDEMLLSDGATGLAFSQKGVAILDGEEIYVEKVMAKDLESWKKRKGLELGDMRLLGDHKDAAGKRRLDLNSAVELMKGGGDEEAESDFPIQGTRAAKEYHQAVALGTNGFLAYHEQWLRQSGVQKRASAAHIHRNLCEGLRLLHSWDQVDGSTTPIGEHLSRWAIQTELAVERNPAQPDYSGLDIVSGSALLGDGRASASKFGEWVTFKLKERSQIWKQERLYAQERRQAKGGGKGPRRDDQDSDDDAGIRKKKKKSKGGKGGDKDPPVET